MDNKKIKIEKTEAFIACYEREECLWNVYSADYKDRNLKSAAIERIKNEFNLSGKYLVYTHSRQKIYIQDTKFRYICIKLYLYFRG